MEQVSRAQRKLETEKQLESECAVVEIIRFVGTQVRLSAGNKAT